MFQVMNIKQYGNSFGVIGLDVFYVIACPLEVAKAAHSYPCHSMFILRNVYMYE